MIPDTPGSTGERPASGPYSGEVGGRDGGIAISVGFLYPAADSKSGRARPRGDGTVRFLTARKAREAEDAAARAGGIVEVLKLSQADLGPAEDLLHQAREHARARNYDAAAATARRAEALAATLEERYLAVQRALQSAEAAFQRMRDFGLATTPLDAAIAEARSRATATVIEDGVAIPNYIEARVLLEKAASQAQATIDLFEAAGSAIFVAGLAVDALRESQGDIDNRLFYQMVLRPVEAVFERATEQLAMLRVGEAIGTAKAAEEMALRARADYTDAVGARSGTERLLAELRGDGAIVLAPERLLEQGSALLQRGRVVEAKELLDRAEREAVTTAADFRRARQAIADARGAIVPGEVGEDAVGALRDAERALHSGLYRRALEFVEESNAARERRQSVRETLAGQILETRARVEDLKAAKADYARDVEEMVERAEKEFTFGNFGACFEDLQIANLLIGPKSLAPRAAPSGNGKDIAK